MDINNLTRVYTNSSIFHNIKITLEQSDYNYLINVMRKKINDIIRIFNGKNGEWLAKITFISKKSVEIEAYELIRAQSKIHNLSLIFALVKNNRSFDIIEKACELGVSDIYPILTRRTNVSSLNLEKANIVAKEAAEQCERDTLPVIHPLQKLSELLLSWPKDKKIIFANESENNVSLKNFLYNQSDSNYTILIGPEGGWAKEDLEIIMSNSYITSVGLGPRILRADTASIALLSCLQMMCGDWQYLPRQSIKD